MVSVTNAHTHLELTGLAHLCPQKQENFFKWLHQLVIYQQKLSKEDIKAGIKQGIEELKACGTTHIGDITYTGHSIAPLLKSGLQGIIYFEIHSLNNKDALQKLEQAKSA